MFFFPYEKKDSFLTHKLILYDGDDDDDADDCHNYKKSPRY